MATASPKFRSQLEDNVFVANYVETHKSRPELDDFIRFVKEGRIAIAPIWTGIFQGLPDGEVQARVKFWACGEIGELNLLEEMRPSGKQDTLRARPYSIRTQELESAR